MWASKSLKMYNQKMHNFYFFKRAKYLSMEECCISGYMLLFKSPSDLWRQSFSSDMFTELIGVDERRLDLPDQLSLITALHYRPARKKTFLLCHALYFSAV